MNIAIGTLILLSLILPGALFRAFLIKSESFENPLDTSKVAELIFILVPSISLHYLAVKYYLPMSDYNFELKQLYYLIAGDSKGTILNFKEVIEPSFLIFLEYIFVQCIIGMTSGFILKWIILFFALDLRWSSIFSISNEWDNLLSSRSYVFEQKSFIRKEVRLTIFRFLKGHFTVKNFIKRLHLLKTYYFNIKTDNTLVNVIADISGKSIIYEGILHKYYLSAGNNLDKIYLTDVRKKDFMTKGANFNDIDSHVLVIKGDDIVNLNVIHLYYEDF